MKVEHKTITPDKARAMLERNAANRPLSLAHVANLAADMKSRRWLFNGDTIAVSGDGRLVDGQHRLSAVIESGVPLDVLVVEGVPFEAFVTKDIGRRRSAADTLAVRGESSSVSLAAALRMLYMLEEEIRSGSSTVRKRAISNAQVQDLMSKHPDMRRSVRITDNTKRLMPRAVLAACHYLFAKKDQEAADAFVRRLVSGADMQRGEPIYWLRERLVQNASAKAKLTSGYIAGLTIKAWNHARLGRNEIRHLRLREEGSHAEAFPEPI